MMAAHPRMVEMQTSAGVIVPLIMILKPTHSMADVSCSTVSVGSMLNLLDNGWD
jgi:hypothetical protein